MSRANVGGTEGKATVGHADPEPELLAKISADLDRSFADGFLYAHTSARFQALLVPNETSLVAAANFTVPNGFPRLRLPAGIGLHSLPPIYAWIDACACCHWSSPLVAQKVTRQIFDILWAASDLGKMWCDHPWLLDNAIACCAGTNGMSIGPCMNALLSAVNPLTGKPFEFSAVDGHHSNNHESGLMRAIPRRDLNVNDLCEMIQRCTVEYLKHVTTYTIGSTIKDDGTISVTYGLTNALKLAVTRHRPSILSALLERLNPILDTEWIDPLNPQSEAETLSLALGSIVPLPNQIEVLAVSKRLDELESLQASYYHGLPNIINEALNVTCPIKGLLDLIIAYASQLPRATYPLLLTEPFAFTPTQYFSPPLPTKRPTHTSP